MGARQKDTKFSKKSIQQKNRTVGSQKLKEFIAMHAGSISIKTRLIIICVLFGIVPLLIVNLISSSISSSTLKDTTKQLTTDMVIQTRSSINYFINDVEKNMTKFVVNDLNNSASNALAGYELAGGDLAEKTRVTQTIDQKINYIGMMEKTIGGAAIVHNSGAVIGKVSQLSEDELAACKAIKMEEETLWQKGLESDKKGIYFIRQVKNDLIGEDFGKLVCLIKMDSIIKSISEIKLLEGADVYIIDREGKMIYNKDSNKETADEYILNIVNKKGDEGNDMKAGKLIAYATASNGWKVVAEIPQSSLTSKLDRASLLIWLLVLLAALLAAAVGMIVSKSISAPIIKIMHLMKQAEEGDLTVQIKEKRKDELGMLCSSFNHMIANIRRLLEETQGVIAATLDDGKVLKLSTQQSVEAFEQLALSIEDITQGSSNQAEDAGQSSAAMTSLAASIQRVMETTKNIFENNQGAKDMIEEATTSIELLNTTMDSSIQISNKIKTSITELSLLNKNIEEIMKLVDDISEQTNLLALNASIEAARAGAVGRGFAVVANEVKSLSEQSKKSTESVRKTLNTIEVKTKDAVNLVKEANNVFANQEQAVKKTYQAFNNIIERLKGVDTELSRASNQVSDMETLKEEMTGKINRIRIVTEDTASATEEVNALSEQQKAVIEQLFMLANKLTNTMDQLKDSVQHFKVE